MTTSSPANRQLMTAIGLLLISALLFSVMGVCVRYASHSVDNATIVFFRNIFGLLIFLPLLFSKGLGFLKTQKLWMHTWRSVVGLMAMYGFFYAIAHLKLSNAMVFTYSSPVFIPLIAWLFLKEKITAPMLIAAAVGLVGVLFVAKPDQGMFNLISAVGLGASFLAAMAYVTVRALTATEPPERIVFYFCLIGSLISAIPMFWSWRPFSWIEFGFMAAAGLLASVSQVLMSYAYKLAPAGQIGPVNYSAIVFAGILGYLFWAEIPDQYSLIGFGFILLAVLLCSPLWQGRLKS